MARTVSKRARKMCLRRTAKALHKKAKTRRQHQLVLGKASKKCAKKRIMRMKKRRTATRRSRQPKVAPAYEQPFEMPGEEPASPERPNYEMSGEIPTPQDYEQAYNELPSRPAGLMPPTEYADIYEAFQNTPCNEGDLSRTTRRLLREGVRETGLNTEQFKNTERAKLINAANLVRRDECRDQGTPV